MFEYLFHKKTEKRKRSKKEEKEKASKEVVVEKMGLEVYGAYIVYEGRGC